MRAARRHRRRDRPIAPDLQCKARQGACHPRVPPAFALLLGAATPRLRLRAAHRRTLRLLLTMPWPWCCRRHHEGNCCCCCCCCCCCRCRGQGQGQVHDRHAPAASSPGIDRPAAQNVSTQYTTSCHKDTHTPAQPPEDRCAGRNDTTTIPAFGLFSPLTLHR